MTSYAPQTELPITMDDVLRDKINGLKDGICARAIEGDRSSAHPQEDLDAMHDAGLFGLEAPQEFGGMGVNSAVANDVVRQLAVWNSSSAHILFVHSVGLKSIPFLGNQEQTERYMTEVVKNGKRFGVASSEHGTHVLDWKCRIKPVEGGYLLNGAKLFCSGSGGSDYIMVFAVVEGAPSLMEGVTILMVPTNQPGVVQNDDWDNMGQRQTSSQSISFNDVFVPMADALGEPGVILQLQPSMWALYYQSAFTALHAGMAEGALLAAIDYARTKTRPWIPSGIQHAVEDPYIQRTIGRMQTHVSAMRTLINRANEAVILVERGMLDRGEGAIRVAEAKIFSTEVALDVSTTLFQVCGARASGNAYGLDRFWRNARTMTLHDPIEWKYQEVGNFLLTDTLPTPAFYS